MRKSFNNRNRPKGGDGVKGCQIDRERWARLTLREQMGNIGSEAGRAIGAKRAEERFGLARESLNPFTDVPL
jgi:hypothetical protein